MTNKILVAYTTNAGSTQEVAETIGETLSQAPENDSRLSFREKYATVTSYLKPALSKVPLVKPVSAGFFAAKLDDGKLNVFQMLFVMLLIGAQPGDPRNWEAIRGWASSLRPALLGRNRTDSAVWDDR